MDKVFKTVGVEEGLDEFTKILAKFADSPTRGEFDASFWEFDNAIQTYSLSLDAEIV